MPVMTIDVKWFRDRLSERGLSQRQLARKLGLDQSATMKPHVDARLPCSDISARNVPFASKSWAICCVLAGALVAGPAPAFSRVCLRGGVRVLGVVRRGYRRGRWNVSGPAGTIDNADVEWVQPVVAIRT